MKTKKEKAVPCIVWGRNAEYAYDHAEWNSVVALTGRFQSRPYMKMHPDGTEEQKTAYEISVARLSVSTSNLR
ncbi:single-stranded DNA-binding protein [Enterocloster clostridioformis]